MFQSSPHQHTPHPRFVEFYQGRGYQSLCAVPIVLNADLLGMLNIHSHHLRPFNAYHQMLLDRLAPHLEALCHDALLSAMRGVEGVELLRGKCVFEVKPRGAHKGQAILDFMTQAPFAGRMPVFVGDDVTDEAGFAAVQSLGGWGIKVGEGPTMAQHRCMTPAALRGWLSAARTSLQPQQRH